ncbi:MAG: hypothetical protein RR547_07020 [Raoultibacter sp.]
MKVTLYKIDCYEAIHMSATGTYYSLNPWPGNGPGAQGGDDGGVEYALPDGYTVGPNAYETEMFIWDPEGKPCKIMGHTAPRLVVGPRGAKKSRQA